MRFYQPTPKTCKMHDDNVTALDYKDAASLSRHLSQHGKIESKRRSGLCRVHQKMLAEAIKNARDTASQFAQNSGSLVGSVSRGNQGVFDITDKDPGSPEYKKIRLVSTLRFLLK